MIDSMIDFVINGGRRKITKPIFMKDFTKESSHLNSLIEFQNEVTDERKRKLLERDINFVRAGIQGEANVAFELKNSLVPMICLHDIHVTDGDYSAQIDFVVILRNSIILLETKKLNGDIEISADGDFIRLFKSKSGKVYKKEGIYSPIAQNERHVRILEKILKEQKLINRMPIKSYVIIANPKTIINKKHAPKRIQQNIYKYEQITYLLKKELNDKSNNLDVREKYLFNIANYLKENHNPKSYDLNEMYSINRDGAGDTEHIAGVSSDDDSLQVEEKLKKYRLEMTKRENLKAFMVFTNKEMENLIEQRPKTEMELRKIKGFGDKKVAKYGKDILEILNEKARE